ncbi:separase isoform X1 [Senna tora]|uniref:Separase isoform X1 n=1 Tax=Senna tora TaxID=362788 RepID=A0A834SFH1_9FABA|nr:separase isoform X1 [Senna tora]
MFAAHLNKAAEHYQQVTTPISMIMRLYAAGLVLISCHVRFGDGDLASFGVNEACTRSAFLLDILGLVDNHKIREKITNILKNWCVANDLFERLPAPIPVVKQWVKMECKRVKQVNKTNGSLTLYCLLSSSTKISMRNIGIILKQELLHMRKGVLLSRICHQMQMKIIAILLQDVYMNPESSFEKALTQVRKGKVLRPCGIESIKDCIQCFSEAITKQREISGGTCTNMDYLDHQLSVAYCLWALCTLEYRKSIRECPYKIDSSADNISVLTTGNSYKSALDKLNLFEWKNPISCPQDNSDESARDRQFDACFLANEENINMKSMREGSETKISAKHSRKNKIATKCLPKEQTLAVESDSSSEGNNVSVSNQFDKLSQEELTLKKAGCTVSSSCAVAFNEATHSIRFSSMEFFTIEVHYGGKLVGEPTFAYEGGNTRWFENCDIDRWSYWEVVDSLKELGIVRFGRLWFKLPGHSLENGLDPIKDDKDAMAIANVATKSRKVELYVSGLISDQPNPSNEPQPNSVPQSNTINDPQSNPINDPQPILTHLEPNPETHSQSNPQHEANKGKTKVVSISY